MLILIATLCTCCTFDDTNSNVSSDDASGHGVIDMSSSPISSDIPSEQSKPQESQVSNPVSSEDNSSVVSEPELELNISETLKKIYPEELPYIPIQEEERAVFSALTVGQKELYNIFYNAVMAMKTGNIDFGNCNYEDFQLALYAVKADHPEIFWFPREYVITVIGGNRVLKISESGKTGYTYTKEEVELIQELMKSSLQNFVSELGTVPKTQYEIELFTHDWMLSRMTYDKEAEANPDTNPFAWTSYGGLIKGSAVCEGYARTFQLLLNMVGIQCGTVTGMTDELHIWNYVKISGQYYYVDPTFNDTNDGGYYTYFNVTTDYIEDTHLLDPDYNNADIDDVESGNFNFNLPFCDSTKYNYAVVNGFYIDEKDDVYEKIANIIADKYIAGKKSAELVLSPMFKYSNGVTKIGDVLDLEHLFELVNKKLPEGEEILLENVTFTGITNSTGITIHW